MKTFELTEPNGKKRTLNPGAISNIVSRKEGGCRVDFIFATTEHDDAFIVFANSYEEAARLFNEALSYNGR